MYKIVGGAGFVGSLLQKELDNFSVLDKRLKGIDYVDITVRETLTSKFLPSDSIVLLAAEHRDDISPVSKYYETNVQGTQNILDEMDKVGCKNLIFTSSVAVYGLNKSNPNENFNPDPFNHYGKSKWQAEQAVKHWYDNDPAGKSVTIIRPTVIF
jgi:nucleoside-diphosphate-sugar epimerase